MHVAYARRGRVVTHHLHKKPKVDATVTTSLCDTEMIPDIPIHRTNINVIHRLEVSHCDNGIHINWRWTPPGRSGAPFHKDIVTIHPLSDHTLGRGIPASWNTSSQLPQWDPTPNPLTWYCRAGLFPRPKRKLGRMWSYWIAKKSTTISSSISSLDHIVRRFVMRELVSSPYFLECPRNRYMRTSIGPSRVVQTAYRQI